MIEFTIKSPSKFDIYGDLKCADSESVIKNIPNRARF